MSYLPMGDVSSDQFNSTKYPGVCKPSNVTTLATFKRCQAQLNRVAAAKGVSTIAADGDIGPGTLGLLGKFQSELVAHAMNKANVAASTKIALAGAGNCSAVAKIADVIADVADSYADMLKAPATAPAPRPIKPPVLVSPTGIETPAPAGAGLFAAWESSSNTTKIAAIAVAGGLAFVALGGAMFKKRRGRR